MLPTTRKSGPAPCHPSSATCRAWVVAVEVRLPIEGTWFNALAASVRREGLFLSTSNDLEVGTRVILALSLPGGRVEIDGTVEPGWLQDGNHLDDDDGPAGVYVAFDDLSDEARERIEALHRWNAMTLTELAAQVA